MYLHLHTVYEIQNKKEYMETKLFRVKTKSIFSSLIIFNMQKETRYILTFPLELFFDQLALRHFLLEICWLQTTDRLTTRTTIELFILNFLYKNVNVQVYMGECHQYEYRNFLTFYLHTCRSCNPMIAKEYTNESDLIFFGNHNISGLSVK